MKGTFWCLLYFAKTMLLDRTIAPPAYPIQQITFQDIEVHQPIDGIQLYRLQGGKQPVVRCELIFEAGNRYEHVHGSSFFCLKNLSEGTAKLSANDIAQKLAHLGYFVEYHQGAERAVITMNGLSKYLVEALKIVLEIVAEASFPDVEFDIQCKNHIQSLLVNQEKTTYLASVAFKESIFGKEHYLGKHLDIAACEQIDKEAVVDFYKQYIQQAPFNIFVSGQVSDALLEQLMHTLVGIGARKQAQVSQVSAGTSSSNTSSYVEKDGALQTSIRIGRRIFDRKHGDYVPFLLCNTLLGGFFGSRLMKNIREEKGYTYGIHSSLVPVLHNGYWLVATDVKKDFAQHTVEEIEKEIVRLQNISVDDEELNVVKNFLIGDFAASFNSVFELAERHKMLLYEELDKSFFMNHIDKIRAVDADQIKKVANSYLNMNDMTKILVG